MAKRSATHSQGGHSIELYRGYLIQPIQYGQFFAVQTAGFTIATCPTSAAARAAIDAVTA